MDFFHSMVKIEPSNFSPPQITQMYNVNASTLVMECCQRKKIFL